MADWTRSFVALLESEAGIALRMDGDRIVADFACVPAAWEDECAYLLTAYRAAIVAELRSRGAPLQDRDCPEAAPGAPEPTRDARETCEAAVEALW